MPSPLKWSLPIFLSFVRIYISSVHATCPTHFSGVDLTTRIMSDEEYKLWSSSSCMQFSPYSCYLFSLVSKYSPQPLPCSQTPSIYVLPFTSETKFHTHKNYIQNLELCMLSSLWFEVADGKTEGSELNGCKHYPSSICSRFPHECNSNLLLFSDIWTLPHFQRIC
jgi:hypothetical protein